MKPRDRTANRLINEKSPYLLQHAHNPVNWYPWGDEAFVRARTEDRPLFLSIGYSTCHWCHVMERESFEDPDVARILNSRYLPVKVDREERPDVDHIYMTACQAMTGHGGWPLTAILTPGGEPFFVGTYFPRESKWGRPGLVDILKRIADLWQEDRDTLLRAGRRMAGALKEHFSQQREEGDLAEDAVDAAFHDLDQLFDGQYGGFGRAPKFPVPHTLTFLLRHHWYTGSDRALEMVATTLEAMYRGGIYDHIGSGFSRYSTDRRWLVPHFEKMLYDNALLAVAYLECYQVTGRQLFSAVARGIFQYLLRDMKAPGGGFCSAEDADSEGAEGAFYVWTPDEVLTVLGKDRGTRFCRMFGISEEGNFEGKSIPNLLSGLPGTVAAAEGLDPQALEHEIERSRASLLKARSRRTRPFRDDKVLTSWNALTAVAMATGSRVLGERALLDETRQILRFIDDRLTLPDGRLLARYRDGEAALHGYLDDYAFLAWAHTETHRAAPDPRHLSRAIEITNLMLDQFWDSGSNSLLMTADDTHLIVRPRELHDGAMPSGSSVAAMNLARLAHLTGDRRLRDCYERLVRSCAPQIRANPSGHAFFLQAIQFSLNPVMELVVAGPASDPDTHRLLRIADERFFPGLLALLAPEGPGRGEIEAAVPHIRDMHPMDGRPTAYVCRDFACQRPITDPVELRETLAQTR